MCLISSYTAPPYSSEFQDNPGLSIPPAPHVLPDNPQANITSHRQLTSKQSPWLPDTIVKWLMWCSILTVFLYCLSVNWSHWWPSGCSRHLRGMKCTVMICRSWVRTPVGLNLGCVVLLSQVVLEPNTSSDENNSYTKFVWFPFVQYMHPSVSH